MNVLPRIDSAVSTTSDTSYRNVIERLKRFDMLVYMDINSCKDLIYILNLFIIIIKDNDSATVKMSYQFLPNY